MKPSEERIFNLILANELAIYSDELIPKVKEVIKNYEINPRLMKKAQMHSLLNIASNTSAIGDVTDYIDHQIGRHPNTWGKEIDKKKFGIQLKNELSAALKNEVRLYEVIVTGVNEVLKSQGQPEVSITAQEKKNICQQIKIKILRKFVQHLVAAYEIGGIKDEL